jgi:hypothetical protein
MPSWLLEELPERASEFRMPARRGDFCAYLRYIDVDHKYKEMT